MSGEYFKQATKVVIDRFGAVVQALDASIEDFAHLLDPGIALAGNRLATMHEIALLQCLISGQMDGGTPSTPCDHTIYVDGGLA